MGRILLLVGLVVVLVLIGAVATMLLWAWVVPDVFSGAVEQDILPASLTLWQAFKLSIFLVLMFGSGRAGSSSK